MALHRPHQEWPQGVRPPNGCPRVKRHLGRSCPDTDLVNNLKGRILSLKALGLAGTMVIRDIVRRRIFPLRHRPRLACCYYGDDNIAWTFSGGKFLFILSLLRCFALQLDSPLICIGNAQRKAILTARGLRATWRSWGYDRHTRGSEAVVRSHHSREMRAHGGSSSGGSAWRGCTVGADRPNH